MPYSGGVIMTELNKVYEAIKNHDQNQKWRSFLYSDNSYKLFNSEWGNS